MSAPGYLLGELGVSAVAWRLTGDAAHLEAARQAAVAATPLPELELMWAAPGAALVARAVVDETADAATVAAWREVLAAATRHLVATLQRNEASGHWLWTQDLSGCRVSYLGGIHGFAGNAQGILAGLDTLSPAQARVALDRIAATLVGTALVEGDLATWPTHVPPPDNNKILAQYCHGAPGVVIALARFPQGHAPELDRLLTRAGELTWRAGPLVKPHGLCHGTAGNAYAFLTLAARTGEARWRDRAKLFALHALAQSHREHARHGRRRMSLWLGDLGLAVFLADLVRGEGERFPTLERL